MDITCFNELYHFIGCVPVNPGAAAGANQDVPKVTSRCTLSKDLQDTPSVPLSTVYCIRELNHQPVPKCTKLQSYDVNA